MGRGTFIKYYLLLSSQCGGRPPREIVCHASLPTGVSALNSVISELKSGSPDQGRTRTEKASGGSIPFKITGTNKGQNELRNSFNKRRDSGIKDGFGLFVFQWRQCFAFASVFGLHCVADVLEKEINRQCHLSHANIADYR